MDYITLTHGFRICQHNFSPSHTIIRLSKYNPKLHQHLVDWLPSSLGPPQCCLQIWLIDKVYYFHLTFPSNWGNLENQQPNTWFSLNTIYGIFPAVLDLMFALKAVLLRRTMWPTPNWVHLILWLQFPLCLWFSFSVTCWAVLYGHFSLSCNCCTNLILVVAFMPFGYQSADQLEVRVSDHTSDRMG